MYYNDMILMFTVHVAGHTKAVFLTIDYVNNLGTTITMKRLLIAKAMKILQHEAPLRDDYQTLSADHLLV